MFEFLTPKFGDFFDRKAGASQFLLNYYELREQQEIEDPGWKEFKRESLQQNLLPNQRPEDLVRKFARDSQRSFSSFVAGDIVLFEYNTLKDDKNSYFVLVVGTSKGNGVFFNSNTKNELMSCFLIDDATDLNTLAAVVDVLHSEAKPDRKDYSSTQGKKNTQALAKKSNVSQAGVQTIFPKNKYRTFRLNGMETVYKLNLNG